MKIPFPIFHNLTQLLYVTNECINPLTCVFAAYISSEYKSTTICDHSIHCTKYTVMYV